MAGERRGVDREWGLKVYGWIEEELLTEENTDTIIEVVAGYVPFGLGFVARKILDRMLPEDALIAVREIMQRLGWLDDRDRFVGSPFDKAAR